MLCAGEPISDIKNRLGHENIQSTMTYLQMDLTHKRSVQEQFIQYSQSLLNQDPRLEALIDWENRQDMGLVGHAVIGGNQASGHHSYIQGDFIMLTVS